MVRTSNAPQDVLPESESVLVELEDGTRLVEIDGSKYRVSTPFGDGDELEDERRARLWIALYSVVDGFERPPNMSTAIPLDVVLAGKPAVSTYLYAVRGHESEDVAELLDVKRGTVWDYLSEIRGRADDQGADE